MNPEGVFIEATSPDSSRDLTSRGGVGVWQGREGHRAEPPPKSRKLQDGTRGSRFLDRAGAHGLSCRPNPTDYLHLRAIYLEKLEPIYPVVERRLVLQGGDSLHAIVVEQIVSLAAAADPSAVAHLHLRSRAALLSRNEFSQLLSTALRATIDGGLVADRVFLTRVLLSLSMYMQPASSEEADLPAFMGVRAIHEMNTLGIHIPGHETCGEDASDTEALFCAIWALDRLNAAWYGQACLIHERDIGWDLEECFGRLRPSFRLFLMIAALLEKVIDLYRPRKRSIAEPAIMELPIFEQMIVDAGAEKLPSPLIGKQ